MLSICSYNILAQSYIKYSKKNGIDDAFCLFHTRVDKIISYLHKHMHTHIIGLQEVESDVFDTLQHSLIHHQAFYVQRKNAKDGLAIFIHNECQVQDCQSLVLNNEAGKARRVAQILDCVVEGKALRIVHIHLDFDPPGTRDGFSQGTTIINKILSLAPRDTIIFGDYNAQVGDPVFDLFLHHGFVAVDTTKETCFHGTSWSRVDHIFYQASMNVSEVFIPNRSVSIPNQEWGSDHLPLTCTFERM